MHPPFLQVKASIVCLLTTLAFGCFSTQPACSQEENSEPSEESSSQQADPTPEALAEFASHLRRLYQSTPENWPAPTLDEGVPLVELGTPRKPAAPADNPTTPEKAALGLSLFFDPRLSGSQQLACASCHVPDLAWSDGRALPAGNFRTQLRRHSPTLVGVAHSKLLFWDGRASSLEEQAAMVISAPDEMAGEPNVIVQRLQAEPSFYRERFKTAFGDEQITFQRVTKALAAFQRSLIIGRTAFDKFLAGKHDSLDDSAIRGLHLFRTKARCMNCHNGPMLQNDSFHNVGLTYYGRKYEDLGRYHITRKAEDIGRFKTPTLRNVARSGPWMHNGLFPSLDGVLRLYNAGMPQPKPKPDQENDPLFPKTDPLLKPLHLTRSELADLKAFLESLNEPPIRILEPPFPPLPLDGALSAGVSPNPPGTSP